MNKKDIKGWRSPTHAEDSLFGGYFEQVIYDMIRIYKNLDILVVSGFLISGFASAYFANLRSRYLGIVFGIVIVLFALAHSFLQRFIGDMYERINAISKMDYDCIDIEVGELHKSSIDSSKVGIYVDGKHCNDLFTVLNSGLESIRKNEGKALLLRTYDSYVYVVVPRVKADEERKCTDMEKSEL